ncbi:MAG: Crp/Fnr family transcriptional regulator [Synechococcaceae cyanobacterium SM2_3_60]|nr:Crp/Fnr family transcriptional regulator [Synechococcaceae cyanobacterium SM2_3_60]
MIDVSQTQAWSEMCAWAVERFHSRTFDREERIPTRPGLLYIVQSGAVRQVSLTPDMSEVFVGFAAVGIPFEVSQHDTFQLQAYSHVERTTVMWFYWEDLQQWPLIHSQVQALLRYQLQRKLLWLGNLGQRRASDRLKGLIMLLVDEYGIDTEEGRAVPWTLTHAQIGDAIGATRVTVTRALGMLRSEGFVRLVGQNQLCLPYMSNPGAADDDLVTEVAA